jgi:3-oxoacyl-[acyl-carrier protein] reductase
MTPSRPPDTRASRAPAPPLDGRVALVTGGSRGIGAAVARALHAAGATVVITYREREDAARQLTDELGPRCTAVRSDARDERASEALVQDVVARHGRIDTLVPNAGVWRGGRVESLPTEDWELVVDTSLGGAFRVVRAAVPFMRAAGHGRIVVMSSAVGLTGFPGDAAYAAAKAGLLGFVRALAKELGADGITVNGVAPGLIETDMTAEVSERSREQMLSRAAIRRVGHVDEIAAAVRYLVVDGAYVTGQTLVVDGGLTL